MTGTESRLRLGVVGYGYWGPNLLRNFAETPGVEVVWCSDVREERRELVGRRYPAVRATARVADLFEDSGLDAVAIATPVHTHHRLAKQALEAGKHVLVEKPMAATVAEAEELVALADRLGLVLMVDHTFVYTGAVQKMKELLVSGELGDLYYFDSVRVNLGLFQHDIDVLWDLAPHDLSILTDLVEKPPRFVSAHAVDHTGSGLADMAYMTVHYDDAFLAHFHVNWLSPVKVRRILVGGSRRMVLFDDMEPSEKIRVYDRGVTVGSKEGIYKTLVDYRTGDMWAPRIELKEALARECEHFVECVRLRKAPRSGGEAGLAVVRLLDAASRSMAVDGRRVPV
ncbi:myo-inositol 2-dehydrogenase / D-chiro-inositol 1-dehydrogenase [Myxococcaceae bacterium]|nr:myo-inositol 2-dehydrogenase / D-chiro-inositol 1-dehydrogenase [Myxococcaceae bacterium]